MATVLSEQEFRDCVLPLHGLEVSLAWKGYGSAVFLELGRLSAPKNDRASHERGEACLSVAWDWRVENASSILFGSSNTRPEIEVGIRELQGSRTDNIVAVGAVPELAVTFSNGKCLRSMAMTSGNPQWGIKLPSGSWLSTEDGLLWLDAEPKGSTNDYVRESKVTEEARDRWGTPTAEPVRGRCSACDWFRRLDGDFFLLDYGVCIAEASPFDGLVVCQSSGCPVFSPSKAV
jgi:hypothetical protein